jgi:tetratricopeptide (TPR) repeat protein
MSRRWVAPWWIGIALAATLLAQDKGKPAPDPSAPTTVDEGQLPPDEDKNTPVEKQYSFNPLQSRKEVTVGEFYQKKGDFRAAMLRYREATRWNAGNADAWMHLALADEKTGEIAEACQANQKYLDLSPTAKNAADVKKKLEKMKCGVSGPQ